MSYDHFVKVEPPKAPLPLKKKECEHKFVFIEKINYNYVFYCEKCLLIRNSEDD